MPTLNVYIEELKFDRCCISVQDEKGDLIQIANIQNNDYLNDLIDKIGNSHFIIEHNKTLGTNSKELVIPLKIGEKGIGIISVEKKNQNLWAH